MDFFFEFSSNCTVSFESSSVSIFSPYAATFFKIDLGSFYVASAIFMEGGGFLARIIGTYVLFLVPISSCS